MQLIATSPAITYTPNLSNGAVNSGQLTWTRGILARYGNRARHYFAQITADGEMTVSRKNDIKGDSITDSPDVVMSLNTDFRKAGNFSYCERSYSNRAMNIFQQNSGAGPQVWAIVQFSHQLELKVRENEIQHPGDASVVKTFTRNNKNLYYIVVNADLTETLHYINLALFAPGDYIAASNSSISVVADKTDIMAGEESLYVATENGGSQEIRVYDHGNLSIVQETWTNIYTSDSYDDYPVQMLEIDPNDILVRKKGTQLYRIIDGLVTLLSDTLDEDLSRFRVNNFGLIYVEGVDFVQTPGVSDEHKDAWYLINDNLLLDTFLTGVVREILNESGIADADIDLSEILNIQCRGFHIKGQTQKQALQELMIIHDFDLPVINGKVTARKIVSGDTPQVIDNTRIGMALNSPPDSKITITDEIADTDYPKQITVKYKDTADRYVNTAVIIRSQDSKSVEFQTIDLSNHSLSESIARDVAHQTFRKWFEEKAIFTMTVSIYYLEEIQPGSLLELEYDGETYELKVTNTVDRDILRDITMVKNYV